MDSLMKITKGVPHRLSKGELHITLIYSKTPISFKARGKLDPPIEIRPKHYSIFTTVEGENCLVLEIESEAIVARHNEIMSDTGASYDHPDFKPHISLSYDVGEDFDLDSLPKLDDMDPFYANAEYASKLDVNWGTKAA